MHIRMLTRLFNFKIDCIDTERKSFLNIKCIKIFDLFVKNECEIIVGNKLKFITDKIKFNMSNSKMYF